MNNLEWYAAKTIYKSHFVEDGRQTTVFEERVVLFRAADFDDTIAKAEAEAAEYCRAISGTEYLGFMDVYLVGDETIGHGTEVYSLMRVSDLSSKDYLDQFYDDGKERRRTVE
jgi:hypothetical protein